MGDGAGRIARAGARTPARTTLPDHASDESMALHASIRPCTEATDFASKVFMECVQSNG